MLVALVVAAGVMLGCAQGALAWKPFTHVYTGDQAWTDVTADGEVTINGREYAVDPVVVNALTKQRSYYNAGVIGPDGFPDLVMGQSVIHPEKTGEWLRYLLTKAWQAQTASGYSEAEKEQILAFAYGFLTHAAGDHAVEHNLLGAWIELLEAQRGKAVDTATATRFIAYARDLIAIGG